MPGVAELADAPDSKSGDRKVVKVRLLSPGPESPLRLYTVSSQNPDFGIISLQRFAQRLHQKALKNAILVDLCGVSVSKVYTRDRTPRYEVRLDFESSASASSAIPGLLLTRRLGRLPGCLLSSL